MTDEKRYGKTMAGEWVEIIDHDGENCEVVLHAFNNEEISRILPANAVIEVPYPMPKSIKALAPMQGESEAARRVAELILLVAEKEVAVDLLRVSKDVKLAKINSDVVERIVPNEEQAELIVDPLIHTAKTGPERQKEIQHWVSIEPEYKEVEKAEKVIVALEGEIMLFKAMLDANKRIMYDSRRDEPWMTK